MKPDSTGRQNWSRLRSADFKGQGIFPAFEIKKELILLLRKTSSRAALFHENTASSQKG